MTNQEHDKQLKNAGLSIQKLDAIGWGLFFIWMGIAFLADVGWGLGLLGIGIITLWAQAARKYLGLPLDRFGLMIGLIFVVGGIGNLFNIQLRGGAIPDGLLPILFIAVGVAKIVSTLRGKPKAESL